MYFVNAMKPVGWRSQSARRPPGPGLVAAGSAGPAHRARCAHCPPALRPSCLREAASAHRRVGPGSAATAAHPRPPPRCLSPGPEADCVSPRVLARHRGDSCRLPSSAFCLQGRRFFFFFHRKARHRSGHADGADQGATSRYRARVLDAMVQSLNQGDTVALFAEGTTSDGAQVLDFRSSFAVVANVAVQPIALRYSQARHARQPFGAMRRHDLIRGNLVAPCSVARDPDRDDPHASAPSRHRTATAGALGARAAQRHCGRARRWHAERTLAEPI